MPRIMLLRVTIVVILLAGLFIQYVEGFERVIEVTGSDIHDDLINDGEDINATKVIDGGSDLNFFSNSCCIYSNCS